MGEHELIEALEDLRSKDLPRRMAGLAKIAADGGKEKLPILIEVLQDQSWHLRAEAARAVVKEGARAVPRLIKLLEDGIWFVRAVSAQVLGEIGDERALIPLIHLLQDRNDTVRRNTKEALRRVFEAGSVPRISATLRLCVAEDREAALKLISSIDPIKAEMIVNVGEDEKIPLEEEGPSKEDSSLEKESTAEMMRKLRRVLKELSGTEAKGGKG